MNKFTNDSKNLELQRIAYNASKAENECLSDYLDGLISEEDYLRAMEFTKLAVESAIAKGVSHKDLPAA